MATGDLPALLKQKGLNKGDYIVKPITMVQVQSKVLNILVKKKVL